MVNKSNGMTLPPTTSPSNNPSYRYFVAPGNNHQLLKQIMKPRWWWSPSDKADFEYCEFIWTPWKKNVFLAALPRVNPCHDDVMLDLEEEVKDEMLIYEP